MTAALMAAQQHELLSYQAHQCAKPVLFGNFELQALLGQGGMASVYRARELFGPRRNWIVAIKRLRSEFQSIPVYVNLLDAEAELCRYLRHPRIVKVFDTGITNDIQYIVMEYVDGYDLGRILERCKNNHVLLPIDFAVFVVKALLEALEAAHNATTSSGEPLEIVHCDVSPANIYISRAGAIKLGDFGVAKSKLHGPDTGYVFAGKPQYLSPEMLKGKSSQDADLWAAAATLYELLTLQRPFHGRDTNEIMENIRQGKYRRIRELRCQIGRELAEIIDRAFSKKASNRFPNAREFGEALAGQYDPRVGEPVIIAAITRELLTRTAGV